MTYEEIYDIIYNAWMSTDDSKFDIALDVLANLELYESLYCPSH